MEHEAHMQRETKIKLALEGVLVPKLMRKVWLIAAVWKDVALQRASMEAYREPNMLLRDELRNHYSSVEKRFYDAVTRQIGRELPWPSGMIGAAYYGLWADERARFNALKISLTIRKRLDNVNTRVIAENGAETPVKVRDRVNEVERIADQQWPGYVNNVAVTETQAPAEAYKSFEALAAAGALAAMSGQMIQIQDQLKLVKRWGSQQDERVRNRHASTDGQVVPVDQPFNVGGQMMMFPGDTSGTATLDNVLNCRCFAAYYEVGDE